MDDYLTHVYKLHTHRTAEQSIAMIDHSFAGALVDRYKALMCSVFGNMSDINNAKSSDIIMEIACPLTNNNIHNVGKVSYKDISACVIGYSKNSKNMLIITPSFANDEFVLLGLYSGANYTKTSLFSRRTYCEFETAMHANTCISPYMVRGYFNFLHHGYVPEINGSPNFGIH